MNVSCNKCGKRYVIADDKVAGKASVKIRCKQCQNLITVQVGGSSGSGAEAAMLQSTASSVISAPSAITAAPPAPTQWEDEATKAMPAMDFTSQWFAMIQGKQTGPLDVKALMQKATSGEVSLRTYLWKPGMDGWKRASDIPEVTPIFAGVSVGATATGPARPAIESSKSGSRKLPQRDVATANETPVGDGSANGSAARKPATTESSRHDPAAHAAGSHDDVTMAQPAYQPASSGTEGRGTAGRLEYDEVTRAAAPMPSSVGSDLFSDINPSAEAKPAEPGGALENTSLSSENQAHSPDGDGGTNGSTGSTGEQKVADPFEAMGAANPEELPPPGEATKFFIAQAGVNKRNPPWKIAMFAISIIGLPIAALYLLSTLHVIPQVTVTTADGQEVQQNFFSAEGISGLADLLSGDAKKKKEAAEKKRLAEEEMKKRRLAAAQAQATPKAENIAPDEEAPPPKTPENPDLAAFYGTDSSKKGMPKDRSKDPQEANIGQSAAGGVDEAAAAAVMKQGSKSFENCISEALRKQPNLRVGKVELIINVGASGTVTGSAIEPKQPEGTDWASCLMGAAKRLRFPASDQPTELRSKLVIGVALN